jgi:hypothetical protein
MASDPAAAAGTGKEGCASRSGRGSGEAAPHGLRRPTRRRILVQHHRTAESATLEAPIVELEQDSRRVVFALLDPIEVLYQVVRDLAMFGDDPSATAATVGLPGAS